jgi:hypothetical protein
MSSTSTTVSTISAEYRHIDDGTRQVIDVNTELYLLLQHMVTRSRATQAKVIDAKTIESKNEHELQDTFHSINRQRFWSRFYRLNVEDTVLSTMSDNWLKLADGYSYTIKISSDTRLESLFTEPLFTESVFTESKYTEPIYTKPVSIQSASTLWVNAIDGRLVETFSHDALVLVLNCTLAQVLDWDIIGFNDGQAQSMLEPIDVAPKFTQHDSTLDNDSVGSIGSIGSISSSSKFTCERQCSLEYGYPRYVETYHAK